MSDKKIIFNTNIKHFPIKESWLKKFKELNADYVGNVCFTDDDVIKYGKDADIIEEVLHTPITRKVFENLPKLKAIVKHGIGYENIDMEAARDFKVSVSNTPGFCADEVSSSCIMLLLAFSRNLCYWNKWIREGNWKPGKPPYEGLDTIKDKNIGIIGFGNMGRAIYKKLAPFDCNILIYDPYVKFDEKEFQVKRLELKELIKKAQYIILICPCNKETYHLLDEEEFKIMRKDAVVVNIGRGPLVNEKVLIKYLQDKKIAGAALDVFEEEPISPDNPLLKLENVILTPHQAGTSPVMASKLEKMVFDELVRLICGMSPIYVCY
ncbi:MAG: C-terminal binding protein [Actinobacteria bacterium]|nr:C-terminal binding protein [Actinomycetota bacterium]